MREIKFRGINNFGEWVYGSFVHSKNLHPAIYFKTGRGTVKKMDWQAVKIESVGQYTGLKDKNGKEVYEGDIIEIPDDYDTYGFNAGETYEIYFAFGGFRCKPKYDKKARGFWLEDDGELKIIGKIYENKKLLK